MRAAFIVGIFISIAFIFNFNVASAAASYSLFQFPAKAKVVSSFKSLYSATNTPGYTANQVNLEGFIERVRQAGKNNPQIEGIIAQIRKDASTTTDLMSLFLSQEGLIQVKSTSSKESRLGQKIVSFFNLFKPKQAYAITGLPFGGPIFYTFYCTCSGSWLVWIGPTANLVTSNMVLDYYSGSQAFLSYNLPFTRSTLGKYSPATSICYFYYGYGCTNIPGSRGLITPLAGSSSL